MFVIKSEIDDLTNRMQRVQLAPARFVLNRYSSTSDILKLGWLHIRYNKDFNLSEIICKDLYNEPSYLKLELRKPVCDLRSSNLVLNLEVPTSSGTFQECTANFLNSLPKEIRNCTNSSTFIRKCKGHFSLPLMLI